MRVFPEPKIFPSNRFYYGRKNDKPNLRIHFRSKLAAEQTSRKSSSAQDDGLFDDIPGMKHLLNAEKPIWFRIIWSLVLLVSTCICVYQITDRIKLYLSKPVLSETKLLFNSTIKAPSITMCPQNSMFHKDWYESYGCTCPVTSPSHPDCCFAYLNLMDKCNTTQVWDVIHYKKALHTLMIYESNFLITGVQTIHIPTILTEVVTPAGTCVTASFDEPIPFRGTDISILIKLNEELARCDTKIVGNMFIHEDKADMTYLMGGNSLNFEEITFFTYGLSAKTFRVLNRTERPCATIEEINKCQIQCIENKILQLGAKCSLPYMKTTNLVPCTDFKSSSHTYNLSLFVTSSLSLERDCKCLRKCETNMYTLYYQVTGGMKNPMIFLYIAKNIVETTTEYYSYSLIDLFCDLGGNLGLYLGLCIPTIIDVVQSMIIFVLKKI